MDNITQILKQVETGDAAAAAKLLPLVYDELRRLAARKMYVEKAGHTLQPTALVHEAWMRMVGDGSPQKWNSRGHFYSAAAEAMRRILIESARRKSSLKHGGDLNRVEMSIDAVGTSVGHDWASLLSLDNALTKLKTVDVDCYQLVMLRFFSGLTVNEAAKSLEVSSRTAKRNWSYARAWLQREMDGLNTQNQSKSRWNPR